MAASRQAVERQSVVAGHLPRAIIQPPAVLHGLPGFGAQPYPHRIRSDRLDGEQGARGSGLRLENEGVHRGGGGEQERVAAGVNERFAELPPRDERVDLVRAEHLDAPAGHALVERLLPGEPERAEVVHHDGIRLVRHTALRRRGLFRRAVRVFAPDVRREAALERDLRPFSRLVPAPTHAGPEVDAKMLLGIEPGWSHRVVLIFAGDLGAGEPLPGRPIVVEDVGRPGTVGDALAIRAVLRVDVKHAARQKVRWLVPDGDVGGLRALESLPLGCSRIEGPGFLVIARTADVDPDPALSVRGDVLGVGEVLARHRVRNPLLAVPFADRLRRLLEGRPRTAAGIERPAAVRVEVEQARVLPFTRRQVEREMDEPGTLADGKERAVGEAGKGTRTFQRETGAPGKPGGLSLAWNEPGVGRIGLHEQSFLDGQPGTGHPAVGLGVIQAGEQLRPLPVAQPPERAPGNHHVLDRVEVAAIDEQLVDAAQRLGGGIGQPFQGEGIDVETVNAVVFHGHPHVLLVGAGDGEDVGSLFEGGGQVVEFAAFPGEDEDAAQAGVAGGGRVRPDPHAALAVLDRMDLVVAGLCLGGRVQFVGGDLVRHAHAGGVHPVDLRGPAR